LESTGTPLSGTNAVSTNYGSRWSFDCASWNQPMPNCSSQASCVVDPMTPRPLPLAYLPRHVDERLLPAGSDGSRGCGRTCRGRGSLTRRRTRQRIAPTPPRPRKRHTEHLVAMMRAHQSFRGFVQPSWIASVMAPSIAQGVLPNVVEFQCCKDCRGNRIAYFRCSSILSPPAETGLQINTTSDRCDFL